MGVKTYLLADSQPTGSYRSATRVRQSSQVVKHPDYTSNLSGLPGISDVFLFQLGPTGVEDIERLLSRIQRGLRDY